MVHAKRREPTRARRFLRRENTEHPTPNTERLNLVKRSRGNVLAFGVGCSVFSVLPEFQALHPRARGIIAALNPAHL
jgi:hypothetical protein